MEQTRQCNHCKEIKDIEEFAWSNRLLGKRQKQCRSCLSFYSGRHYQENKEELLERKKKNAEKRRNEVRKYVWDYLKKHPCENCGAGDPRVLEFHHINPGDKTNSISRMVADGASINTIKAEIANCAVLCANCHRVKTYEERGWYQG